MMEKKKDNFIYGTHAIEEALDSGKEIDKIWVQEGHRAPQIRNIIKQCEERDIPFQFVPRVKLERLVGGNHQGIAASISPVDFSPLEVVLQRTFESGEVPLFLILDRITDVRNFGAICRTAEAAGVHAIIVPARGSAAIGGDAVKTSAGALMHISVCRSSNLKDTIEYLKNSGLKILSCTEKGAEPVFSCNLTEPLAIIMGSEEDGISPEYIKRSDLKAFIPMKGKTSSLNVSVAAAVIIYECIRQRALNE